MENTESTPVQQAQPSGLPNEIKNYKNKKQLILIGIVILLILIIFGITAFIITKYTTSNTPGKQVSSFEECAAAGNPIMESFPRQCRTLEGILFVENVELDNEENQTEEENSQDAEEMENNQNEDSSQGNQTTPPPGNNEQTTTDNSEKTVLVFFSKIPNSYENDPTYVESVNRTTTRVDVATFAMEELIKGPTDDEVGEKQLISELGSAISGESNCSGKDFTITIENKVATVKFCKDLQLSGAMSDARIEAMITQTVNQFDTIDSVVILDKNGNDPFDAQGY